MSRVMVLLLVLVGCTSLVGCGNSELEDRLYATIKDQERDHRLMIDLARTLDYNLEWVPLTEIKTDRYELRWVKKK